MTISTLAEYDESFKQIVTILQVFVNGPNSDKWNSVPVAFNALPAISNTMTGLVPVAGTNFPTIQPFDVGYITRILANVSTNATGFYIRVLLCDRLWHAGAFSAGTTTLSLQPSYASRLPNGSHAGLQLWFESTSNAAGGTQTASYTNENGVTGRTASTGAVAADTAGAAHVYSLQAGDTGIQKIDSVTFAGSGTFNVVIVRPLFTTRLDPGDALNGDVIATMERLCMPAIYSTSALMQFAFKESSNAASGPTWNLDVEIAGTPTALPQTSGWDASTAIALTLSNSNLTATSISNTLGLASGVVGHSSGKYYFEVLCTTVNTSNNSPQVGIGDSLWAGGTGAFYGGPTHSWTIQSSPAYDYGNNSYQSSGATFANGDVVMVAVDITAQKIWYGKNGTWLHSGNPGAGTGAAWLNLTTSTPFKPCLSQWGTTSGSEPVSVARFVAGSFGYTVPSGFSPWEP